MTKPTKGFNYRKPVLERTVKAAVKKRLDEIGAYQFWPVQTGYGTKTVDVLACWQGLFIGIECKRPGKKATKLQDITLQRLKDAGALVYLVDSVDAAHELLEEFVDPGGVRLARR